MTPVSLGRQHRFLNVDKSDRVLLVIPAHITFPTMTLSSFSGLVSKQPKLRSRTCHSNFVVSNLIMNCYIRDYIC